MELLENQERGGGEIRTHEAFRPSGFQDRRDQPLCHPSGGLNEERPTSNVQRPTLNTENYWAFGVFLPRKGLDNGHVRMNIIP